MALIKCCKCGRMISDKAKACPKCGEPVRIIKETPNESRTGSQSYSQPDNSINPSYKKKASPTLITVIALLSLAVLALGGFVLYKMVYEPSRLADQSDQEVMIDMFDYYSDDTTVVLEEQTGIVQEDAHIATDVPAESAADYAADYADDYADDGALTRFVVVTGVNVRLRTSPEINDYNIITDSRGKNLHPNKGDRLECVGEYDDFYLVNFKGREVFISKQFTYLE